MSKKLYELCESNFQQLNYKIQQFGDKLDHIQEKVGQLETRIAHCAKPNTSISHAENKVDFLNETFGNPNQKNHLYNNFDETQRNIIQFLHSRLSHSFQDEAIRIIAFQHICSILKNTRTIYDVVSYYLTQLLGQQNENETICVYPWIYAFPSQKSIVYFWNHDTLSWNKMNSDWLKHLFEVVQQHLMQMYAWMVQENHDSLHNIDLVEGGHYLFEDNFDKKCNEFKKMIFQNLN